jgi:MFS family permease
MQSDAAIVGARRALLLLFLVAFFNYMDRYVLSVLLPAIKADLDLSDTLLGGIGTAFTISYVVLGVPIARLADRYSRKHVIALSLGFWSLMTAVCGLAQNFVQLAIARVLVGVGEAGATPPAHSLISDYFPSVQRGKAIAIYSLGAPAGIIVGFIAASWLVQNFSWRFAFIGLGLPGLLLALVVYLKLVEPKRGQTERAEIAKEAGESTTLLQASKTLLSSPAYRHIIFATGLYTVVWLGVVSWLPSYFIRSFEMSIVEVGFWLAMSLGVSQAIGMMLSGILTDKLVKRNLKWFSWIPALAMVASTPLFIIVFLTDSAIVATVALFPAFLIGVFQGPASFAAVQGIAHVRMRATATALYLLVTNLIGGTIGPFLTGLLSDTLRPQYGDDSLRYGLLIISLVFGTWAAIHYALSARTIGNEIR